VLSDGMIDFAKLQSVFGLVRALGGSETTAWWFQIPTALATAVGVAILWRRQVPFELKAAALAIGTLFIGGMLVGRLGLSAGLGAGQEIQRVGGLGLALALAGAFLVWLSTTVPFSGLGLFVTGLGVAVLYPLGIAAALAGAPGQAALAGNRLTMATGTALLFAPFALGAIADLAGVVAGWSVVPGLVALALVLLFVLPRERVAGATAEG